MPLTYPELTGSLNASPVDVDAGHVPAPPPDAASCRGALELLADLVDASHATAGERVPILGAVVALEAAIDAQERELVRLDERALELEQAIAEREL